MSCELSPSPRHTAILTAFNQGQSLEQITKAQSLTPDDLLALLSAPGNPERLLAIRSLRRFDADLTIIRGQAAAAAYLHKLLEDAATTPVEGRRAATALLRGPGPAPRSSNPDRKGGAGPKLDISDWLQTIDDEDDYDLDEPGDAPSDESSDGPNDGPNDGPADDSGSDPADDSPAAHTDPARPAPTSIRPPQPPTLPPDTDPNATPDQVVAHQLAALASLDRPQPRAAFSAIYRTLSLAVKMGGVDQPRFLQDFAVSGALELKGAAITAEPAKVTLSTTPPSATVCITAALPDGQTLRLRFHLLHDRHPLMPWTQPSWSTHAILRDDTS